MTISFDREYRWDSDRYGMAFLANVDGRRVICVISGEALQDLFGASSQRASMEEAFLRNRAGIEKLARNLIVHGAIDTSGKLLIRARDVAAGA